MRKAHREAGDGERAASSDVTADLPLKSCRSPIANRLKGTRTLLSRYPVGIRKARIAWGLIPAMRRENRYGANGSIDEKDARNVGRIGALRSRLLAVSFNNAPANQEA